MTRIAVLLLVLGFGTKAGLVPLHAWLPDAHRQAPAPVSALMSGVLLSVAFYAILRVKVIADAALGPDFIRALLLVLALASLAVAASLLIAQRDYKRMLAYSSIEHMGLIALGAAIGSPLAIAAVLLHILGHGLAKSVLFLAAGQILQLTGYQPDRPRPWPGRAGAGAGRVSGFGVLALSRSRRSACSPANWASRRPVSPPAGLGHRGGADPGAGHRGGPGRPHQPDAARRPHPGPRTAHRRPAHRGAGTGGDHRRRGGRAGEDRHFCR